MLRRDDEVVEEDDKNDSFLDKQLDKAAIEAAVADGKSPANSKCLPRSTRCSFRPWSASYARAISTQSAKAARQILKRIKELANPKTLALFAVHLSWGYIKGLVTPLTGLIGLFVGAVGGYEFWRSSCRSRNRR